MTTTKDRIATLNKIATETGKTRREVYAALAPTLKLDLFERAQLEHALAKTPEPPTAAERHEAEQHAAKVRAEFERQRTEQGATDLATFRKYRELNASNPFAAAHLMNRDPHAISRGRALDTTPDGEPPPKNAA